MADPRASVDALVLAAGRGERTGLGPKAFLMLGGRTLLERAIEVARTAAARVIVGVPEDNAHDVPTPRDSSVVLLPGGKTRLETTLRLFRVSSAPIILLHDVVHPFVSAKLVQRVVAAARRTGAAMAAVRETAHTFRGDGTLDGRVLEPAPLWLARKPLAFSREAFARALETSSAPATGDAGTAELLLAAGQPIVPVPVEPWNIKVTTPDDWALALEIERLRAAGALRELSADTGTP